MQNMKSKMKKIKTHNFNKIVGRIPKPDKDKEKIFKNLFE